MCVCVCLCVLKRKNYRKRARKGNVGRERERINDCIKKGLYMERERKGGRQEKVKDRQREKNSRKKNGKIKCVMIAGIEK